MPPSYRRYVAPTAPPPGGVPPDVKTNTSGAQTFTHPMGTGAAIQGTETAAPKPTTTAGVAGLLTNPTGRANVNPDQTAGGRQGLMSGVGGRGQGGAGGIPENVALNRTAGGGLPETTVSGAPGVNGAGAPSTADALRAQYEKYFQDLLSANEKARAGMMETGQANIAALQRRNATHAAMAGRGIGGGFLGGQRTALTQGMNMMNQGLMANDAQRMEIIGRRMGEQLADARAAESRQFALDRDEAAAKGEEKANTIKQQASDWATRIQTQTGMNVNDPSTMRGPYSGEILAAWQKVQAGGGQAAIDELNSWLVKRQDNPVGGYAKEEQPRAQAAEDAQKSLDAVPANARLQYGIDNPFKAADNNYYWWNGKSWVMSK